MTTAVIVCKFDGGYCSTKKYETCKKATHSFHSCATIPIINHYQHAQLLPSCANLPEKDERWAYAGSHRFSVVPN